MIVFIYTSRNRALFTVLFQIPKPLHFELVLQLRNEKLFPMIGFSVLGKEKRGYFGQKSVESTVLHLKGQP